MHSLEPLRHTLVVVCSLVSIAALFALRLLFTGAAPVTEFLLIAGGTDAALTCFTVISRGAGVGKFAVCICLFGHKNHAPFYCDYNAKNYHIQWKISEKRA